MLDMPDDRFDPRAFRDALGRFATGVAVVLARDSGGRMAGMTINSFSSVSLNPPLVLWSMRNDTASASIFHDSQGFTISLLTAAQEEIARRFARSNTAKLEHVELVATPSGLPRLAGAAAWFDCQRWAAHAAGDHDILIGRVTGFGHQSGPTLLFHDGRFGASDG